MITGSRLKVRVNKIFKLCNFPTNQVGTVEHICARDMTCIAHVQRSRELINYYMEGAKDIDILCKAIWHLALALVRYNEEIRSEGFETTRK